MKKHIILAVSSALALISFTSYAQKDERAPGLYTVVGEESIPLSYSRSGGGSVSVGTMGVTVGHDTYKYSGTTSGVNASNTFILVINPDKRTGVITGKKFDMFIKGMTPDNMLLLPLVVNQKKERREYDAGTTVGIANARINTSSQDRIQFTWEQISDNSFKIVVEDTLIPGEYGFIFRTSKLSQFNYSALLCFTVPEKEQ